MTQTREVQQREYEELLIDILEQDHDLAVRRGGDSLNRRRSNVATLNFAYQYASGCAEAKVIVSIDGLDSFSITLSADFANEDSLQRSAEDTEGLALFLSEHLERRREKALASAAAGEIPWGRREDD